jgi:acetyl esterase
MPLNPEVAELLRQSSGRMRPHQQPSAQAARAANLLRQRPPGPQVQSVEDIEIPGPAGVRLPARIYEAAGDSLGVLVYFHGGGWVLGNLDTHDGIARSLANAGRCKVVSVAYRVSPEYRFPTAADDAHTAAQWAADQFPDAPVAVGGDSAGGNLAAAACLLARARGGPLVAFQWLMYPITDCRFDTASYVENAVGYNLQAEEMRWYWTQYLGDLTLGEDPLASPLRAADLASLPPAIVMTAEFDPLRDEGNAYAQRLREAGVPVFHHCYAGLVHSFLTVGPPVAAAQVAYRDIGRALAAGFRHAHAHGARAVADHPFRNLSPE